MISLLDDYFHVSKACYLFENYPGDRFLIRFLSCITGENLWSTRLLSFVFILATIYLFIKIFKLKRKEVLTLGLFIHPMLFFPVFYASQFATSFSVFWSALTLFSLERLKGKYHYIVCFLVALMGPLGRFESLYIFFMLYVAFLIFKALREVHLRAFIKEVFKKLSQDKWGILLIIFGFKLGEWVINHYQGSFNEFKFIYYVPNVYPKNYYYGSQVWAIILYLRNFIFPFTHTFFGDWTDWYDVGRHYSRLFLIYFTFLSLLFFVFCKSLKSSWKYLIGGLMLFILISTGFSIFVRSQWYYPSRQYLATMIFISFLSIFFSQKMMNKWFKSLLVLIITLNSLSLVYSSFVQYRSKEAFYRHEKLFSDDVDPLLILEKANLFFKNKDYKKSLVGYYKVYEMIPLEMAKLSNAASVYHFLALEGAYRAYEMLSDYGQSEKTLQLLMQGTYYMSTHVCLQDKRIPIQECLTKDRAHNFCQYLLSSNMPRLIQIRKYRKNSIKSFCLHALNSK